MANRIFPREAGEQTGVRSACWPFGAPLCRLIAEHDSVLRFWEELPDRYRQRVLKGDYALRDLPLALRRGRDLEPAAEFDPCDG